MPPYHETPSPVKCQELLKEAEAILHFLVAIDLQSCENADVIVAALSEAALNRVRHSIEEPN